MRQDTHLRISWQIEMIKIKIKGKEEEKVIKKYRLVVGVFSAQLLYLFLAFLLREGKSEDYILIIFYYSIFYFIFHYIFYFILYYIVHYIFYHIFYFFLFLLFLNIIYISKYLRNADFNFFLLMDLILV